MRKFYVSFLTLFLLACAPNKKLTVHEKSQEQRINDLRKDCINAQETYRENEKTLIENNERLERELALKTEMLRRFKLVDEKGRLRTKPDQKEPAPPTGKESWQK